MRVLTHSLRYQTVQKMLVSGRGQELYEAHEAIYKMLEQNETEDMNQAVRKTYFTNIVSEKKED